LSSEFGGAHKGGIGIRADLKGWELEEAFLGCFFAFLSLIFLNGWVFIGHLSRRTVCGNTALRRAALGLGEGRRGVEEQGEHSLG